MRVCDKCRGDLGTENYTLKFKTKTFELCRNCASSVVGFIEKKDIKRRITDSINSRGNY